MSGPWNFGSAASPTPPNLPDNVSQALPAGEDGAPSLQQLSAFGKFLVESILATIALALAQAVGSIPFVGGTAAAYLTSWANNLQTQANNALATAEGASTTASNAQSTASSASSAASTAQSTASTALGNWTSLFSGIPGVSSITSLLNWLNPTTSGGAGIFAPLVDGTLGGSGNPLSSFLSYVKGLLPISLLGSGASSTLDAGNWFTNLLRILGNPTLTTNPSTFNPLTIPNSNVVGINGIPDIGSTIAAEWDQLGAAAGLTGSGNPLSAVAQAFQSKFASLTTASQLAVTNTNVLNIQNNNAVSAGLEATVESNMPISSLGSGSAPTFVTATQAVSAGGSVRIKQAKTLGFHQWWGYCTGTISAFYLNFARMNSAGVVTTLFSSGDLHGSLATTAGTAKWNIYNFPGIDQIPVNPGDVILVEYQVVGSGSVSIAGLGQAWQTNHPTANTEQSGLTRNTGASGPTALTGTYTNTGNTPYIGLGVSNLPANYEPPDPQTFNTAGTHTCMLPTWLKAGDLVDLILLGAGGGAAGSLFYIPGGNGGAGTWVTRTLVYGTDIPLTTSTLTVVVGAGGAAQGGLGGAAGNAGGASSVSGTGVTTVTAAGGTAGSGWTVAENGPSPGNQEWPSGSGDVYFGGTSVGDGNAGSAPGGGAASSLPYGGGPAGAPGMVVVVPRQA